MGERSGIPFLAKLKTNRSTPAEPGEKLEAVGKHTVSDLVLSLSMCASF
eukprot:SAG31_NODE_4034_length_3647_cov_26.004510_2_plen_49_part_00